MKFAHLFWTTKASAGRAVYDKLQVNALDLFQYQLYICDLKVLAADTVEK